MRTFISSARVRAILADARTDKEVVAALRRHCISYGYSTETGELHIRIPCRHGVVRVYRKSTPVCSGPVPVIVSRFFRPRSVAAPEDLYGSTAWTDRLEVI